MEKQAVSYVVDAAEVVRIVVHVSASDGRQFPLFLRVVGEVVARTTGVAVILRLAERKKRTHHMIRLFVYTGVTGDLLICRVEEAAKGDV